MDGSEVTLDVSEHGGACGVWVEKDGKTFVEVREMDLAAPPLIA